MHNEMYKVDQVKEMSLKAGDFITKDGNLVLRKNTNNIMKSKKCIQCNFASSNTSYMKNHLKTHSEEVTNKCSLCDFTSSWASSLNGHLKIHSGEKSNKCSQCDFASSSRSR